MKVSVILPVHNGAETLPQTLKSLAEQTYKDFELLVCIDGSTDHSKQIIESYRCQFKILRIIENSGNRGLGPTMNRLVYESHGDYLAVAEQDDYYYPERLALQVEALDCMPDVGMVSGIAEFWDGENVVMKFPGLLVHGHQYPEGKAMFLLNYRNRIKVVNSCIMFKKAVHLQNGLYFSQHYPNIPIDWAYVLRFSLVSKIHGIPQVLVRLDRRHSRNSVTRNKKQEFSGARELIRSFAFEYPNIISKEDYSFAMRGQISMEVNHLSGFAFIFCSLKYILIYPQDPRFIKSLKKRINKKLKT